VLVPGVPEPPDPLRGVDAPVEPGLDDPVELAPTPAQLPDTERIDCTVTISFEELPIPGLDIDVEDPALAAAPAAPADPDALGVRAPLCVPEVPAAPDVPAVPEVLPDMPPLMVLPAALATVVISTRLFALLDRLTFDAPGDAITV